MLYTMMSVVTPPFAPVELLNRLLAKTYKYCRRGKTNRISLSTHSQALASAVLLCTLASPARRLTKGRRARPANASASTPGAKHPTPTVTVTVDAYPDIVRCPSPIPLDEPPFTTTAERTRCLSHLEPLVIPPRKSSPPRRPALRRGPSTNLVTRWNRVDVSDSVLIAELEVLRRNVELANANPSSDGLVSDTRCNSCAYGSSSSDDDRRWRKAQKSAFGRRELIKTELNYLEGLLQLENKDRRSRPPALLLAYLPALTATCCQLLDRFLSDPTAYGVSLAFVESEQQLEEAFVPWCSVIGSAFVNPSRSRSTGSIAPRKLTKPVPKQVSGAFDKWKPSDVLEFGSTHGSHGNTVANVFRRLSRGSASSRLTSGDNSSTGSLISDSVNSSEYHASPPKASTARSPLPVFRHSNSEELPYDTTHQRELYPRASRRYLSCIEANRSREPSRARSFRELAILPTQRVMRYSLFFRDLLANTPETCCNRPVIEEALSTAMRIAEKCDRAQRNTAFARCD